MYAIVTRYQAARDGGGRINATTSYNGAPVGATVPYPHHAGEGAPAHRVAVEALLAKMPDAWAYLRDTHRLVSASDPGSPDRMFWVWVEGPRLMPTADEPVTADRRREAGMGRIRWAEIAADCVGEIAE